MRQGPEETEFRETLLRIRKEILTDKDLEAFNKRVAANVPESELDDFVRDGVAVFAEHADCNNYNEYRLQSLGNPIFEIPSKDSRCMPKTEAPHILKLAVGAKVV